MGPSAASSRKIELLTAAPESCQSPLSGGSSPSRNAFHADLFADRIIRHLRRCGIDLSRTTWQTDNGSEFIGSWQAKDDSAFTKTIQRIPGQIHRTIPPGQHRFQADVETVHSLMETEFYEIEPFTSRPEFLDKATTYQLYFNLARKNSGKENKTPWQLVLEKNPKADPRLPLLPPVYLDELLDQRLHSTAPGGYDVWALPSLRLSIQKEGGKGMSAACFCKQKHGTQRRELFRETVSIIAL